MDLEGAGVDSKFGLAGVDSNLVGTGAGSYPEGAGGIARKLGVDFDRAYTTAGLDLVRTAIARVDSNSGPGDIGGCSDPESTVAALTW